MHYNYGKIVVKSVNINMLMIKLICLGCLFRKKKILYFLLNKNRYWSSGMWYQRHKQKSVSVRELHKKAYDWKDCVHYAVFKYRCLEVWRVFLQYRSFPYNFWESSVTFLCIFSLSSIMKLMTRWLNLLKKH